MDSGGRPTDLCRCPRATHRAADKIHRRLDQPSYHPAALTERRPPSATATSAGALAAWVCRSLLSLTLGLGIAKYSQAWAEHALHPEAAGGTLIVVVSVALAVVAARYAASGAGAHLHRQFSRALAVLGTMLVVMLA